VVSFIIGYQNIEDHLQTLFVSALGGPPEKARKIFSVARGLEAKLYLVSAALSDAEQSLQMRWDGLKKRVILAAESRNQIAHSSPVSTADPIIVTMNKANNKVLRVSGGGNSRTELRKKTKRVEVTWTTSSLRDEHTRNDLLFGALVAFDLELRDMPVPQHLQGL